MLAGLEEAYQRTNTRDVSPAAHHTASTRLDTTDPLLDATPTRRKPHTIVQMDVFSDSAEGVVRSGDDEHVGHVDSVHTSDDDDESTHRHSKHNTARRKKKRKKLVSDSPPHERRLFYAMTFLGIALLLTMTYLLAALAMEWRITRHWFDNAFWTTACVFVAVGLVVWVPHDMMWLRDKPPKFQTIYCAIVAIFITLMVSSYHDFVDNRYVTEIMWRVIVLLLVMAVYAIIPCGSFSHGWGGLFIMIVMVFAVSVLVIYPHRDYFRQYAHPADIPSHLGTLIPPADLQNNGIVLLGTTASMIYILYRMYHISSMVYVHDKLFLITQLYMAVMVTLLICALPRFNLPGVVWRNAMNQSASTPSPPVSQTGPSHMQSTGVA